MIEITIKHHPIRSITIALMAFVCLVSVAVISTRIANAGDATVHDGEHILKVHDGGSEQGFITKAATLRVALSEAHIRIDPNDITEPTLDESLVASSYDVNIYRARPVVVRDGLASTKVITAYRTGKQIASQVGIVLNDADITKLAPSSDPISDGAAEVMTIDRATPVTFVFYGKRTETSTRAQSVAEFLSQKGVKIAADDTLSPSGTTAITSGMVIQLWKNGKQTVTVDEDIAFTTRQVKDANHDRGYKEVQTQGVNGKRTVTYEIEMRDGKEVARTIANTVTTQQSVEQVEIIGAKGTYTTPTENEQITWNFLTAKGLTPQQTAGIMGNLMQEHRFNTTGDGLAQWTGSRQAKLRAMYPDSFTTIQSQLDYLWYELTGPYAKVLTSIQAQSSVAGAVQVFQNQYERCGVCVENMRIQYAYDILASH